MAKRSDAQWPSWPDGVAGSQIARLQVDCSVDVLFNLFWSTGSEFTVAANQARGYKQYTESPWTDNETDLTDFENGNIVNGQSTTQLQLNEYKGMLRKTRFAASTMGMKFFTTELQRCREALEGKLYIVEACVHTTATYGDKFRAILRYRMHRRSKDKTELTIEYTIVYLASVSSMIKSVILKGVDGGLRKNFGIVAEELKKKHTIQEVVEAPPESPIAVRSPRLAVAVHNKFTCTLGITDDVILRVMPFSQQLASLFVSGKGKAQLSSYIAVFLAVCVLLLGVSLVLSILQQMEDMCTGTAGWLAVSCSAIFSVANVPVDLRQLLSGLLIILVVQLGLRMLVVGTGQRAQEGHGAAQGTSITRMASDMERNGIKYDGFENAMQRIMSGDGKDGSVEGSAADGAAGKQDTTEKMKSNFKQFGAWMSNAFKKGEGDVKVVEGENSGTSGNMLLVDSTTALQPAVEDDEAAAGKLSRPSTSDSNKKPQGTLSRPASKDWTVAEPALDPPSRGPNSSVDKADNLSSFLKASWSTFIATESGTQPMTDSVAALALQGVQGGGSAVVEMRSFTSTGDPNRCIEFIYENERFQPLRGWGSTWPGHFLPTDRVGRWSTNDGRTSSSFDELAPKLEEGWDWIEDGWVVDKSLRSEGLVDDEGWHYSIDFSLMKSPIPTPGSGKKKLKDFVRRRTWIRTRSKRAELADKEVPAGPVDIGGDAEQRSPRALEAFRRSPGASISPSPAEEYAILAEECKLQEERSNGGSSSSPSPPSLPAVPSAVLAEDAGDDVSPTERETLSPNVGTGEEGMGTGKVVGGSAAAQFVSPFVEVANGEGRESSKGLRLTGGASDDGVPQPAVVEVEVGSSMEQGPEFGEGQGASKREEELVGASGEGLGITEQVVNGWPAMGLGVAHGEGMVGPQAVEYDRPQPLPGGGGDAEVIDAVPAGPSLGDVASQRKAAVGIVLERDDASGEHVIAGSAFRLRADPSDEVGGVVATFPLDVCVSSDLETPPSEETLLSVMLKAATTSETLSGDDALAVGKVVLEGSEAGSDSSVVVAAKLTGDRSFFRKIQAVPSLSMTVSPVSKLTPSTKQLARQVSASVREMTNSLVETVSQKISENQTSFSTSFSEKFSRFESPINTSSLRKSISRGLSTFRTTHARSPSFDETNDDTSAAAPSDCGVDAEVGVSAPRAVVSAPETPLHSSGATEFTNESGDVAHSRQGSNSDDLPLAGGSIALEGKSEAGEVGLYHSHSEPLTRLAEEETVALKTKLQDPQATVIVQEVLQ